MLPNISQESEEGADHGGRFVCPLCTLDFSCPEKLISHVYQVRKRDLNRLETGLFFHFTFGTQSEPALLSVDTLFSPARLRLTAHDHDEQQQELRVPCVWAGPQLAWLAGTTPSHPLR